MGTEGTVKMRLLNKHIMRLHKDRARRRRVRYSLVKAALPFPNMAFIKTEFPASSEVWAAHLRGLCGHKGITPPYSTACTEHNLLPKPHSCSDKIIQ